MEMKTKVSVTYLTIFAALIMLMSVVNVSMAATCSAIELSPCLGAITSGTPPSPACCSGLQSQTSCFCQYIKNPTLKPYVGSPNARKVASACSIAWPSC
ncbi:hypothetical protein AQUCO_04100081v1 [Aquilegia coerulea]|uniref:Bifunctional inhibitor/plant lipid transfer protein/seed storage helical domain-containing protein n=1 Tax=Aquilegia coerulea TaxID=218851 RepID=A0A2G5CQ33_AQUCA|nr:hypothetical protein AQUCO_04100081v1 [Aquilegia coerulea]